MEMITLLCWVYHDDVENIFPVKILRTETIGGLQEVIKRETPEFRDVAAKHLRLYSILIRGYDDKRLENELKQLSLEDKSRLSSRTKVSKLFPESCEEEWLIIVDEHNSGSSATRPVVVPDITLNCWVRGDMTGSIFPIEISSTTTVAALKEVIKNKNPVCFWDVDAKDLALYKVSLPYGEDDSLEVVLGAHTISSLERPLRASQTLSNVFTSPFTPDRLHLVIVGSLSLLCWIRGADPKNFFEVRMPVNARISGLKNVIKVTYGEDLRDISPDRLKLYKIPMDKEAGLRVGLGALGSGHLLQGDELVEKVFNDVPLTSVPRVVVESLSEKIMKPPPSSYRRVGNEDPIKTARESFLRSTPKDKPSNTGTPSQFRLRQLHSHRLKTIPCGRPRHYEEDAIPATLFHHVFAQFVDDCQTIPVTAEDNMFVEHLANAMSDLYEDETTRVHAVDEVFQSYDLHFAIASTKHTGYLTDGNMDINGHRYVIAEFKNEIGSTSAEPYLQAIGYYLEWTRETALNFLRSPLPCFLLAIFGPHIMFAGAAWNLRPTVQVLSPALSFHFHSTDIQSQHMIARHMAAFRKATKRLKVYYENLDKTLPSSIGPPHIFPYPTSYKSLPSRTLKHFQYKLVLDPHKLVFHATEDNGDGICIKFVRTYSCEAHECLVSLECAPRPRGFNEVAGGWYIVAMDMIPDDYQTLSTVRKGQLPPLVYGIISKKIKQFHESGFVHGDVRDTNIMVSRSDSMRFMIVDFDWAGKIMEVPRYPVGVNYVDISRPDGARDGLEILAEHDVYMLEDIKKSKFED